MKILSKSIAFLALLATPMGAQASMKIYKTIGWQAVAAAHEYSVELRFEEKLLLQERTAKPSYRFKLAEGEYQLRIGLHDRFGNLLQQSPWRPLLVELSKLPSLAGEQLTVEPGATEINIDGTNLGLLRKADFSFKEKTIRAVKFERITDDSWTLTLAEPVKDLENYDLCLELETAELEVPGFLQVRANEIEPEYEGNYLVTLGSLYLFSNKTNLVESAGLRFQGDLSVQFDSLSIVSWLQPGLQVGYLRVSRSQPFNLSFESISFGILAAASFSPWRRLTLSVQLGTGYASIGLNADPLGVNYSERYHELYARVDLQVGFELARRFTLALGGSMLSFVQSSGRMSFFSPRLAIAYEL